MTVCYVVHLVQHPFLYQLIFSVGPNNNKESQRRAKQQRRVAAYHKQKLKKMADNEEYIYVAEIMKTIADLDYMRDITLVAGVDGER